MGIFKHPLEIISADGHRSERLEALVDTASMYLWVPASILRFLGFDPTPTRPFPTADGSTIERGLTVVRVRINDETLPTLAIFADEGTEAILGMITLEEFGLTVDTENETLVRVNPP